MYPVGKRLEPGSTVASEATFRGLIVLNGARQMLEQAKKPMLYVGGGVEPAQAVPALRKFIAVTQMPITCTLKVQTLKLIIRTIWACWNARY